MRIFVDANVIISVINKEYPGYLASSKVLSLAGHRNFSVFTSSVCLAIVFYFAEKKHGRASAKKRIQLLLGHLQISPCGDEEAKLAAANKKANDFEDALQYHSAIAAANCACIVIFDTNVFYFAAMEVSTPEKFLQKYKSLIL